MYPDYHIEKRLAIYYVMNSINKIYYIPIETYPCYIFNLDLISKQKCINDNINNNTYIKIIYLDSKWNIVNIEKIKHYKQLIDDLDLNINSISCIEKQVLSY